jgi:hypothetical protein
VKREKLLLIFETARLQTGVSVFSFWQGQISLRSEQHCSPSKLVTNCYMTEKLFVYRLDVTDTVSVVKCERLQRIRPNPIFRKTKKYNVDRTIKGSLLANIHLKETDEDRWIRIVSSCMQSSIYATVTLQAMQLCVPTCQICFKSYVTVHTYECMLILHSKLCKYMFIHAKVALNLCNCMFIQANIAL